MTMVVSDPFTPTVLESDTDDGDVIGDIIANIGNADNNGDLDDDDDRLHWRMNGGVVEDVAARSRSPTPRPERGIIRRLGPVPDVLAYHSRVTATSWAANGVGAAFREALSGPPLSAAVPFRISPGMTVCL